MPRKLKLDKFLIHTMQKRNTAEFNNILQKFDGIYDGVKVVAYPNLYLKCIVCFFGPYAVLDPSEGF